MDGDPPASFMSAETTTFESCTTSRAARSQVSSAALSQRSSPSCIGVASNPPSPGIRVAPSAMASAMESQTP
eukprot:scaffold85_cov358-Pavlova_lutheri.AAC.8